MISDSVELCENWSLFLTQPTYWNKCMTSKNAQCSTRSGFRIFKISREVRVLKQSQSALFSSITHITILFVFTCVMNVRYQTIQSFVTAWAFEAHPGANAFPPIARYWPRDRALHGPIRFPRPFQCPRSRTATLG